MSERALDLRGSAQIVWRQRRIVGIVVLVALLAGVGYSVFTLPTYSATAVVGVAINPRDTPTEVVIAGSNPVLSAVRTSITPVPSLQTLRSEVQVKMLTATLISISAQGDSAHQAEHTANAIARRYVAYVSVASAPGGPVSARILQFATTATARALAVRLLTFGGIGILLGALIGAIVALAIGRGDRRLRKRGELANAIGAPVLASVTVRRPADAAHWVRLFDDYAPTVVHALQLRNALQHLSRAQGMPVTAGNGDHASNGDGFSIGVFSLSRDPRALTLGPQLAVFAASLGIPTALVIGSEQDPKVTAELRAACAAAPATPRRSGRLQVAVADHGGLAGPQPGARLTVFVAVVDDQDPRVAETMRANATAVGVSAGAATAAQLARMAVSLADDGRHINGILVADPEPTDDTTGRVPRLTPSDPRRMPTRLTTTTTETRR